jgi:hypothetical protein
MSLSLLFMTDRLDVAAGYPAASDVSKHPSQIIIWHMLDTSIASSLATSLEIWEKQTGNRVLLETGFSLSHGLLKQSRFGRYPDAIIAPSDVVNLHPNVPFISVPSAWRLPTTSGPRGSGLNERSIPLFLGNHLLLLFNRQLVAKPIARIEQLEPIKSNSIGSAAPAIVWDVHEPYYFLPFLMGHLKSSKNPSWGDRQAVTEAIDDYVALLETGIVMERCGFDCPERMLGDGKLPYAVLGDWALPQLVHKLGDNLGIAPLPSWRGRPLVSVNIPIVLAFPEQRLSRNFPDHRVLESMAKHLQSFETQRSLASAAWRPVSNSSAQELTRKEGRGGYAMFLAAFQNSVPLPGFVDAVFWSAVRMAIRQRLEGTLTASAAARLLDELSLSKDHLKQEEGSP